MKRFDGYQHLVVMNMAGSKLKGLLSIVGGWVGLTFMAVTQVISSIYNEFSAIKEKAESLQAPDSDWMKDSYLVFLYHDCCFVLNRNRRKSTKAMLIWICILI